MKKSVLAAAALAALGFAQQASAYGFEALYKLTVNNCSDTFGGTICAGTVPSSGIYDLTLKVAYGPDGFGNAYGALTTVQNGFDTGSGAFTIGPKGASGFTFENAISGYDFKFSYSTAPSGFSPFALANGLSTGTYGYMYSHNIYGISYGGTMQLLQMRDTSVTPAVAEPETYALMLAGMALMGFVARRRQKGDGA